MNIKLKIWRQKYSKDKGKFVTYKLDGVSSEMTFLEMLDYLNDKLIKEDDDPVAFDNDCREGICGMCGLYINGRPNGPQKDVTTCQLSMSVFKDGDKITVEPWRSKAFPVLKDLVVDRNAFDKIIEAGGYISVNTGSAPEANSIPVKKENSERAFDAGVCIGCGSCVAACKNASAMLFVAAKVSQLALLPQGQVERKRRASAMVAQMDIEGFGACTNTGACSAECPKEIDLSVIARMNREYFTAKFTT
jgi:succinate dehydrogenase / fumarate reductase iron-sulfur subunit